MLYMFWRGRLTILLLVLSLVTSLTQAAHPSRKAAPDEAPAADGLREVVTDDYIVRTDLPEDDLPAMLQRLAAMVKEYRTRTASLSDRADDRRLPLQLYSELSAYTAAGGTKGTAGFYDGERLFAYVGKTPDARSWHTIQHEAFHQYLGAKLGYEVPIWLNEGLAEYFGESLFTGDGFVSGLVPPWRLNQIREGITRGTFMPLRGLLAMTHEEWNESLNEMNYDMAWSLVHFLAHSEGGRHQAELTKYIQEAASGEPLKTFTTTVGAPAKVEDAWKAYWLDLRESDVHLTYAEAAVKTVTSFLGRSAAMRVRPGNIEKLLIAAKENDLPQPRGQELPLSLLIECLTWSRELGTWRIDHTPRAKANVTLTLEDGTQVQGSYTTRASRFDRITTWITPPPAASKPRR